LTALHQHEPAAPRNLDALHKHFLAILPRIELHARICFRGTRCPASRDDAVAETVALAWRWFLRVTERGKDVDEFVTTLAGYAVRHVRSGRRLCGQERSKDVLSSLARRQHGFVVGPLFGPTPRSRERIYAAPHGQDEMDAVEERLRDNTQSPVPDQAAFRIDYPAWLTQLGHRNREMAEDMALDLGTKELAARYRVSPGRISQLRREFCLNWRRFHGEVS
jgi:hypothetical protein